MTDKRKSEPGPKGGDSGGPGVRSQADAHGLSDSAEEVAKEAEQLMFMDMAQYMSQFARSFEASARRWELVVYPSMLAFIILAAYGFYLIYKLTDDLGQIVGQMEAISVSMVNINQNFSSTTNNMNTVSRNMVKMTGYMEQMSSDIKDQNQAMGMIVVSMSDMTESVDAITHTMHRMGFDTQVMGRNIENVSGPMRFMNNFVPW